MNFRWDSLDRPVAILAPMANITTMPFRSVCKEYGADIVFTPMISSNAIIHNPDGTLKIASFLEQEQPVILQIFGYDGNLMAIAAKTAHKRLKCAGIDINMGCPAPKITGNESGSALLRDLTKALNILKHIRDSFDGQLSVKLRLGWSTFDTINFIKELDRIGINAISIHGRTAKQGYRGVADWDSIRTIADSIKIPVIGNGDINSCEDFHTRLKNSNLAGAMIGRTSLGNPWIFKSIRENRTIIPTIEEVVQTIKLQTKRSIDFSGESRGVKEMRKHLCWYIKTFHGTKELKRMAVMVETKKDIDLLLANIEKTAILR